MHVFWFHAMETLQKSSSTFFISLLDTGTFYQCSLPSAYVRKNQNILICHYFQLKLLANTTGETTGARKDMRGSLSHSCLLECHCLLLCSKQVLVQTENSLLRLSLPSAYTVVDITHLYSL